MPGDESEETTVMPNRKKSHGTGPNFIHKLVGKRIAIAGEMIDPTGVLLVGYNRYELLVKDAEGHKIIMKHAIAFIGIPEGEGDPFEVKPQPPTEESP